jgi:hypothetical protein
VVVGGAAGSISKQLWTMLGVTLYCAVLLRRDVGVRVSVIVVKQERKQGGRPIAIPEPSKAIQHTYCSTAVLH